MTTEQLKNTIRIITGHEFNTPMHGILGCTRLLYESDTNCNREDKKIIYEALLESANRLHALSTRLNTWLMLQEDMTACNKRFLLSSNFIQNFFLEEASKYKKSADVLFFSTENEIYHALGDPKNIKIALQEIIINSLKFSLPNHIISLRINKEDNYINIKVSNHSVTSTIAELKTYKGFIQFNRRKYEQQGVGIGLDIARMAIANSGGQLLINGTDHKNDSFIEITIKIPIA